MNPPWLPDNLKFTLATSGAAGMLGGGVAISAMATFHFYENRRWLGWYNSPGSYQIAERYGRIPSSSFFNNFFSSTSIDPADGYEGPRFKAAHSGMVIERTGHLAALFAKECVPLEGKIVGGREGGVVGGRTLQPIEVTVADLNRLPLPQTDLRLLSAGSLILSSIPISVSLGTCAACSFSQDWYAFAMILFGILANGITCLIIGGGKFTFTHSKPAEVSLADGSLSGDGVLTSDSGIILLKGTEDAVDCVTRGKFSLDFPTGKSWHDDIRWCSVLFFVQFISQLLLIPQATLFGQIMFVTSLAVSWIYNFWLSSRNEKIQRNILLENVLGNPVLTKYILGTQATMAVFILLVLRTAEPRKLLNELLPDDTNVYRLWKNTVVDQLGRKEQLEFAVRDWELKGLDEAETALFKELCEDAQTAYNGYRDVYMNDRRRDDGTSQYIASLPQNLTAPILVKRSRAYAEQGRWSDALNDAERLIALDPSSPLGYERRYTALLGMRRHGDAMSAFKTMVLKMSESSNPEIYEQHLHHVREQTKEEIRTSIPRIIYDLPTVLINTSSGRLCNKSEQAYAFESTEAYATLVMSMTAPIDHTRIKQDIDKFYRYAMFSHRWEGDEPLYDMVIKTTVYDLKKPPTHRKLQMLCEIAKGERFNWAWSDTCCINKADQSILQEALVSMFRWYEGSALTIIFLYDVDRLAEFGALTMSEWNSRAWTLQEYHASKVVRIYTKDWTPYLGLTIYNHKDSPEIILEMEEVTGISAESLRALRPGLSAIREKLCLASTRQSTRVEDAAYSLLGIFSETLPATYGEGDKALGRLLSQLLTNSGDTSILAWTGTHNSFNSCLPANITVFSQPLTSHIPHAIPDAEMATITARLCASSPDVDLVTSLYDQLAVLPLPSFLVKRLKLPCLTFKIKTITPLGNGVFRMQAGALAVLEIKIKQKIARILKYSYLVHPWIDFLLDRCVTENIDNPLLEDEISESGESIASPGLESGALNGDPVTDVEPLPSPTVPLMDKQTEFLARLRQQFGALLLVPTGRNASVFKRIATENVITAQIEELTPATLNELIEGVRMLDVL